MTKFPSSQVAKRTKELIQKLPSTGIPACADDKWLSSLGYTKTNDYGILSVFRFLDLTDKDGVPTSHWKELRNNIPGEMANLLKSAYSKLYTLYPNAHDATRDQLESFFRTHTTKGQSTIDRTVATFLQLSQLADFSQEFEPRDVITDQIDTTNSFPASPATIATTDPSFSKQIGTKQLQDMTVNLNLQLTLPESTNAEMLENLFAAMNKYLLSNG